MIISERDQRKFDWMLNLRAAYALWDKHDPRDTNGAVDLQRRIRRVEAELAELGLGAAEFNAFCLRQDRREQRARKMRADAYYDKTGTVVHDQ